tara:strand:- start:19130 stop:19831 length:702 start_codon:yes stop_codon:yes gene_type:complete
MEQSQFEYSGQELDTYKYAYNFKQYYYDLAKNLIPNNCIFLEIGAGIGSITKLFSININFTSWTLLEPDEDDAQILKSNFKNKNRFIIFNSNLENFKSKNKYDVIIAADVIDHIKDDSSALIYLINLLNPEWVLLLYILALNWLYLLSDQSISHNRRYNKISLKKILPKNANFLIIKYIDLIGLFESAANKILQKSSSPKLKQVLFWDRFLIPISRLVDRLIDINMEKIFLLL